MPVLREMMLEQSNITADLLERVSATGHYIIILLKGEMLSDRVLEDDARWIQRGGDEEVPEEAEEGGLATL